MTEPLSIIIQLVLLFGCLLLWGTYLKKIDGGTDTIEWLFPIRQIFTTNLIDVYSVSLLYIYFVLLLLQFFLMEIFDSAFEVYIISFSIIVIYELFIISRIDHLLFGRRFPFWAIIIPLTIIIILSAISSIYYRTFQAINIVDFWILVIKFLLGILGMSIIVMRSSIYKNREAFFILSGFTLMFVLHMFASGIQLLDYRGEWHFIGVIDVLILGYWLGSSLWLRKLSSS